jgi:hypothetical protein
MIKINVITFKNKLIIVYLIYIVFQLNCHIIGKH